MAAPSGRFLCTLTLAVSFFATIAPLHALARTAGNPRNDVYNGWFLTARYRNARVEGDFDGQSALVGPNLTTLVPSMKPAGGGEIGIGLMGAGGGCSFAWSEDRFDADWLGAKGTAKVLNWDVGMRFALSTHLPVLPHGVLGMGFKKLVVKDGGIRSGRVSDANYGGLSLDAGLGITAPLAPRVLLDVSAVHSSIHYRTIAVGKGEDLQIHDGVDGGGWALRAGLLLKFKSF